MKIEQVLRKIAEKLINNQYMSDKYPGIRVEEAIGLVILEILENKNEGSVGEE